MIVECDNCATRFQLDDARVPETGIRVRCSKCKQSFFLAYPGAKTTEAAPEENLDPREDSLSAAVAASIADPVGEDDAHFEPVGGDPEAAMPFDVPAAEEPESDDAEWEFNHSPAETEDAASFDAPEAASDDPFGNSGDMDLLAGDSQFEPLTGDVALEHEPEAPMADVVDESGLGLGDPDAAADPVGESTGAPDLGMDMGPGDDLSSLEEGPSSSVEDLGSPEDWDFLSDEPMPAAPSPTAADHSAPPSSQSAAIGSIDVSPERSLEEVLPTDVEAAAPLRRDLSASLNAIGWALCMTLFVAGMARGLLPAEWFHASREDAPRVLSLGSLEAEGVRGSWLDTAGHGRVFVVSGELRNPTRGFAVANAALRVAVYGPGGERLSLEPVFAGVGLSEAAIRESSISQLIAAETEALQQFAYAQVPPGESLPFHAVLRELPLEAQRFEFELADVAPAAMPMAAIETHEGTMEELAVDATPASRQAAIETPKPASGNGWQAQPASQRRRRVAGGDGLRNTGAPAALAP